MAFTRRDTHGGHNRGRYRVSRTGGRSQGRQLPRVADRVEDLYQVDAERVDTGRADPGINTVGHPHYVELPRDEPYFYIPFSVRVVCLGKQVAASEVGIEVVVVAVHTLSASCWAQAMACRGVISAASLRP